MDGTMPDLEAKLEASVTEEDELKQKLFYSSVRETIVSCQSEVLKIVSKTFSLDISAASTTALPLLLLAGG